MTKEAEAFERLLAIDWIKSTEDKPSHLLLMKEFLRRAALWAKACQTTTQWPFFSIASAAFPYLDFGSDLLLRLNELFDSKLVPPIATKICKWYLCWAMAEDQDTKRVVSFNL